MIADKIFNTLEVKLYIMVLFNCGGAHFQLGQYQEVKYSMWICEYANMWMDGMGRLEVYRCSRVAQLPLIPPPLNFLHLLQYCRYHITWYGTTGHWNIRETKPGVDFSAASGEMPPLTKCYHQLNLGPQDCSWIREKYWHCSLDYRCSNIR